jgi:sugar lactone lactonase YvrE
VILDIVGVKLLTLSRLYFSPLTPADNLDQYQVELGVEPPTIKRLRSNPPVYQPCGGTYYKGLIIWATSGGGIELPDGSHPRPGIYAVNVTTGVSWPLVNNYFGYYFNSPDDLVVDSKGDIWFTDSTYGAANHLIGDAKQQLRIASYRFRPSTGAVYTVDDTLLMPNGIALSPDGKTMYLSDTSASRPGQPFNPMGTKTIYAFDLTPDGNNLINKRPIFEAQTGIPDGVKVAKNGYIVTATGSGVDVLDPIGTLLVRIQTNFPVQNLAFTGPTLTDLWLTGVGAAARVKWALEGLPIV